MTPSPFASLDALSPFMHLVPPEQLEHLAADAGFGKIARQREQSTGGKYFEVQVFRKQMPQERGLS